MRMHLLAAAAATTFALTLPNPAHALCGIYGDINGDDAVTNADAAIIQAYVDSSGTDLTGFAWGDDLRCMDIDGSRTITVADRNLLYYKINGGLPSYLDLNTDGVVDYVECDFYTNFFGSFNYPYDGNDIDLSFTLDQDDYDCALAVALGTADALSCYIHGPIDSCLDLDADDDVDVLDLLQMQCAVNPSLPGCP